MIPLYALFPDFVTCKMLHLMLSFLPCLRVGKKMLMRMILLPVKARHGSENTLEGTGMAIKEQNIDSEVRTLDIVML